MKVKVLTIFILCCSLFCFGESLDNDPGVSKPQWGKKFEPKRTTPIFDGAFSVGVILISFPDTNTPDLNSLKRNFKIGPISVKEYFVEYSQGKSWPELVILGEKDFPKNIFRAPKPKGYYCKFDYWYNPLGYKGAEGGARISALKKAANRHAAKYKLPAGLPTNKGRHQVTCHMYFEKLKNSKETHKLIQPYYGKRKHPWDPEKKEITELYKPKVAWGEPMWPNSSVQIYAGGGAGTLVHELGHVLGAPDFYHAPEKSDGVPGSPCEGCSYGPTGPGYCRYIYNGFLKEENYPTYTKDGRYTLAPRKTNPAGDSAIGCFVMSTHPHYMYHIEYVSGEKGPLGSPGKQGLLVHVINVTMNGPYLGSPDLCYTYHTNDPWFRSDGQYAYFGKRHGRTKFSMDTKPSSRLPNLLDGGLSLEIIKETPEGITIDLKVAKGQAKGNDYKLSILPKVSMDKVSDILGTSFKAHMTVLYRGEPLLTDYGFCWDTRPKPRLRVGKYFPMYHRERYSARILNLKPRLKYYVRAYARNKYGISYSTEELTVTIPSNVPLRANAKVKKPGGDTAISLADIKNIEPLLDDTFSGNGMITLSHGRKQDSSGGNSQVGASGLTTLLTLMNYYRKEFSTNTPKPAKKPRSRSRSRSRSRDSASSTKLDITRIHTKPTVNRPDFRLLEFQQMVGVANKLATTAKMTTRSFDENFNKEFIHFFKMKSSPFSKTGLISPFKKEMFETLIPQIKKSLINGIPVVIGQDPALSSPIDYGLHWVIIDGMNKNNQFHLIYAGGKDRQYKRKTGWYSLDTLLKGVLEARVIWDLKPM
jgi:hypothetical protein